MRGSFISAVGLLGAVALAGCNSGGGAGPKLVSNPDASGKIPAMKISAETKDFSAVTQLVRDLESDDPAVRFYSINTLQRLTGETFNYQYFGDEERRAVAVGRWRAWLAGWETAQRELSASNAPGGK
jgi:hypothetical protein